MKSSRIFGKATVRNNRVAIFALPLLAGMVWMGVTASAEDYSFSLNGSGMNGSGVLQVSNTGPFGASTVTGISGTFTDSVNNFSGAISSVDPVGAPATDGVDTYFPAPAFTPAGLSYDNLFWAGGDSPVVCVDAPFFSGGDFDVYGLAFDVTDGSKTYTIDLWSNGPNLGGYQLNDALDDSQNPPPFSTPTMDGLAYGVNFTASPTPEPGTLLLLGSGMLGLFGVVRRKAIPSA